MKSSIAFKISMAGGGVVVYPEPPPPQATKVAATTAIPNLKLVCNASIHPR